MSRRCQRLRTNQAGEESYLGLEIPVEDVLVVHVLQGERDLHKVVQHLVLRQRLAALLASIKQLLQVATIRVAHHDAQLPSVHEVIHEPGCTP